jgi:hypothetical protein
MKFTIWGQTAVGREEWASVSKEAKRLSEGRRVKK